jgi:hypothetical protein
VNITAQSPVNDLLLDLAANGINISLDGEKLKLRSKAVGLITPEVRKTLSQRKPEIARVLQIQETAEEYRRKGWVKIFSAYLKTELYLVRDESVIIPDSSIPRYSQSEVEALEGLSIDEIKTLHEAKMIYRGTINDEKPCG